MARLRAPRFRGTFLSLAAGVAFSVSPILIQVAYSHGAAVSGVLAWRYLAAALLLVGLAGRKMLSVPLRAAAGAFVLGAVVYALDSALFFGALERTSAPLASLVHYAHLVLVVGVAAMIGRERLTRRRLLALAGIFGGVALVGGAAVNPDLLGLGDGARRRGCLRRLHPALRPAAARHRSAGARRLPHRRRRDVVPRRRWRARLTRHRRGLLRAHLPRGRGPRRLRVRRDLVPRGRAARRSLDGVAARDGRGAGHDRARRDRAQAAPDPDAVRRRRSRRGGDRDDAAAAAAEAAPRTVAFAATAARHSCG